jgi:hypothetical protein
MDYFAFVVWHSKFSNRPSTVMEEVFGMQRKIKHTTDSRADGAVTVADVCYVCKRRVGSQCKRCELFLCAACAAGPKHFCNAQRE